MSSVLTFIDEGGTRSFSTLLILKALMVEIATQEQTMEPQAYSSASPLDLEPWTGKQADEELQWQSQFQETTGRTKSQSPELSRYIPCHYFDYTTGAGFGG